MKKNQKRRIVSKKECLHDLKDELQIMFEAFREAIKLYEQEVVLTPPESRVKGFEASLLNSKMTQCIQKHFPSNWKFGKYRRFVLRVKGFNVLFKKLNNKNMPMNVRTVLVDAIANQLQLSLFDDYPEVIDPIVFFGYQKDKAGGIMNPKVVYIDENQVRWEIDEAEVEVETLHHAINQEVSDNDLVKIKRKVPGERKAN